MKKFRNKTCLALVLIVLANSITIYANNIVGQQPLLQTKETMSNTILEELWTIYPDAWRIQYVSKKDDLYYYRLCKVKGSQNYSIIEYNNELETNQVKELIWIWSKKYSSEIRTIDFKTKENTAKVYLRDCTIIEEEIKFVDKLINNVYHFVEQ